MERLRRLGEDVIAELALTVYWAHRERISVEDIAAELLWPMDDVRAAIERTSLDPTVDALIADGPELDWMVYQRDPFTIPPRTGETSTHESSEAAEADRSSDEP
jgi:hypothetical protein